MSILNQKTLKQPINFEGITLHKGKHAKVRVLPSSPNSGIVFKRVDLKKNNFISDQELEFTEIALVIRRLFIMTI